MEIDSVTGALVGTAIGDAWGLPFEGLKPAACAARLTSDDRYSLLGATGFVSDDTEQTAMVLQSVLRGGADDTAVERHFRRALLGWFLRLPFGIGLATLRSCLKLALGVSHPGTRSAGNGAAMRAPILGALFAADATRRRALVERLSLLTHTDERAVEGAQFCADVAAAACIPGSTRAQWVEFALEHNRSPAIQAAVRKALALGGVEPASAARELGNTGFVLHSVALCAWALVRGGQPATSVLRTVILAGGDTDTHCAIVGAWLGAQGGVATFPESLRVNLQGGPFGRTHLLALGAAVPGGPVPSFSAMRALARNLALYPVVLAHGFWRIRWWRA